MQTGHGMSLDDARALAGFDEALRSEGKSLYTRRSYRQDMERLRRLVDARPLSTLTRADIRLALNQLHAAGLAPRSLARLLSAWRRFYLWLNTQDTRLASPCIDIRAPRRSQPLPNALPVDRTAALLDNISVNERDDPFLVKRDRAIFELMYSSGLRLSELTGLNLNDLELSERLVTVLGKGSRERCLPVGRVACVYLSAWLEVRPKASVDKALFVSRTGKRLTGRQVEKRLALWSKKLGIDRHVHPHMLRHSFASDLLQSSGDLRAVQELLGHANLTTTQIYTKVDFQHLAQVYDSAHPRAHKVRAQND